MLYTNEAELMNIIRASLQHRDNLLTMKNYINEQFVVGNHSYSCSNNITMSLTEGDQIELSYYLVSNDSQYDDISGIMII